ncbi:MAG: LapA family protein [Pseudomonadota bacterium]|nr:LapA family protein [Pseudomonadota bacterium]
MRILKLAIVLIVALVGASFAWLNGQPVMFDYFLDRQQISLSYLLLGALAAGWFLGCVSMLRPWLRARSRIRTAEKHRGLAEKEIANLRDLPIKDAR